MNLKTFFCFSIIIIFFSCGKNKYEKKLIGNWYSFDENEKIRIGKDSLFLSSIGEKIKWSATKNLIKYNYKNAYNDSISKVALKYIFKNDTLLITRYNDPENTQIKFRKADNFLDFLFSKNKVNLKLPVNYNIELVTANPKYGIKIFLEFKNDSIISKTQYSDNLLNLNNDLQKHISFLSTDIIFFKNDYRHIYKELNEEELEHLWIRFNIHFSIFADKKIPIDKLNKIYNKLKNIKKINKIYRIYNIDESKYVDFYKLKGIKL